MLWGFQIFTLIVLLLLSEPLLAARRGRVFFSSPFNDGNSSGVFSSNGMRPIFGANRTRVIAVDGVQVPQNAFFYGFVNGRVQFFDQNGNPISGDGLSSGGPILNGPQQPFQNPQQPFIGGGQAAPLADSHRRRLQGGNSGGNPGGNSPDHNFGGGQIAPPSGRRPIAPDPGTRNPSPGGRDFSGNRANPNGELYTPANPPPPLSVDLVGALTENGQKKQAFCQATPVRLAEAETEGVCKLAFYTAAHCVMNKFGQRKESYQFPTVPGIQGEVFVKGIQGWRTNRFAEVDIAPGFEQEIALATQQFPNQERTVPSDGALIYVTAPCGEFTNVKTVDLAPTDANGFTQLGNYTWVEKRKESVGSNRGTSRRIQLQGLQVIGPSYHMQVPASQGAEAFGVVGGDSGGGLFDDHGRLIGSVSGSALNTVFRDQNGFLRDFRVTKDSNGQTIVPEHGMVFWGQGISWARGALAQKMGAPIRRTPVQPAPDRSIAQNPGRSNQENPNLTPFQKESLRQEMRNYEGQTYSDGTLRERYDYPQGVFSDIPNGGTGKIVIAYFGNQDREDLKRLTANEPLIEFRRYPFGSLEHQHAQVFRQYGINALGIDGLGRKTARYSSPEEAFSILKNHGEEQMLRRFLNARNALSGSGSSTGRSAPPQNIGNGQAAPRSNHAGAGIGTFDLKIEPIRINPRPKVTNPGSFDSSQMHQFITTRCDTCHGTAAGKATPFPEFVYNWNQWKNLLNQNDQRALLWLGRFNSKVVHGEMLTNSGLSREEGEGKAFSDFIEHNVEQHLARPRTNAKLGSVQSTFMVDPTKQAEYFEVLKNINVADSHLKYEMLDFDAMYDSVGNPQWSWAAAGGDSDRVGARPIGTTTPAGPPRPHLFENVNGIWKWKEPFSDGFSVDKNTQGLEKFTVVRFPRNANGDILMGTKGFEQRLNDELPSIWASFPYGTKIYEVFYTRINGKPVPVDVLTREKRVSSDQTKTVWVPDAVRQDSSPAKVRNWVMRQPNWKEDPEMQNLLAAVNNPQTDGIQSDLGDNGTGGTPFIVNGQRTGFIPGSKSVVSNVSPATLARMYQELPMESAAGSRGWQLEPTNAFARSHRGIAVNQQNCMNCHKSAGESFRDVFGAAGLPDSGVYLYGNMQGYDSVLSAPWFSREHLARYGSNYKGQEMRPEWGKYFMDFRQTARIPLRVRISDFLNLFNPFRD